MRREKVKHVAQCHPEKATPPKNAPRLTLQQQISALNRRVLILENFRLRALFGNPNVYSINREMVVPQTIFETDGETIEGDDENIEVDVLGGAEDDFGMKVEIIEN